MAHALLYSLRARLILIVLAALIPCGVYAFYTHGEAVKYARIEAVEEARRLAILTAGNGRELFDGGRRLMTTIGQLPRDILLDPRRCRSFFESLLARNADYANVALIDAQGAPVCSSLPVPAGLSVADNSWFIQAFQGKAFVVSDPLFCRIAKKPAIILAAPVRDDAGKVTHVLGLTMESGWIERLVADLPLPEGTTISVVNRAGKLLARYPNKGDWLDRSIPDNDTILATLTSNSSDTAEAKGIDGVSRLYAFAPLLNESGAEMFVRIGIPARVAYAGAEKALRRNLVIIALAGALAIVATAVFGNIFILRHTNGLLAATKRLASGDLSFRIGVPHSKGELAQIARSFDKMADALQEQAASLKQTEEKFRSIFENASEGIFRTLPNGNFDLANPALAKIFGYDSAAELVAAVTDIGAQLYVEPQKRIEIIRELNRTGGVSDFEIEVFRKNGSKIWLSLNVRAVRNGRGAVTFMEGFATDITRRKLAEERLSRSEANYRNFFENAPLGVFQSTPEGRYLKANDTLARMYGYATAAELIDSVSDIPRQVFADPVQYAALLRILDERGKAADFEAQLRRKDGRIIWTTRNIRTVRDSSGAIQYYEGFILDIDQRKRTEEQLLQSTRRKGLMAVKLANMVRELRTARKAAEEANRAKSDFLARMSHEIRTPIHAVLGLTDAALHTALTAEQRDYLDTVQESADSLLDLINDILDFSKIEAKKLRLESVDFDLREVVHSTMRTMSASAKAKGLSLDLDFADEVPRVVKGDPARLRQILVNLVGNAVKFTDWGGVSITVAQSEEAEPAKPAEDVRTILFEVRDTGMGMDQERRAGIFEEFSQSDDSISRRFGGSGLGLSISKQLVEMMGGRIWATSEPGAGSVFAFTAALPRGEKANIVPAPAPLIFTTPSRSLDVLLVEDNPINVKVGLSYLHRMGHRCTVAASGLEATQALADKKFDIVLMDLEMPEMDGFETTRRIRAGQAGEAAKSVAIVALTAHAVADYKMRCLAAGMDDYISKPVNFMEMSTILERIAGNGGASTPASSQTAPDGAASLDLDAALARLDGDQALFQELIVHFLGDLPDKIQLMREAAAAADFFKLRLAAHNIKSNAMTIGADACATLAAELEDAAAQGRTGQIEELVEQTERELLRVKSLLTA
jgi:PAS domain S-box-containing protein